MEPIVGQLRRMTVPGIHSDPVIVMVDEVAKGRVRAASCVECPDGDDAVHHRNWAMASAEDFGVVDSLAEREAVRQPHPETTMKLEKRKEWALAQDWRKYIPQKAPKRTDSMPSAPQSGEIWAYNDDMHTGVVLVTNDGRCVVLAGTLGHKGSGDMFSHNGGRQNYGTLIRAANDDSPSGPATGTMLAEHYEPVPAGEAEKYRSRAESSYPVGMVFMFREGLTEGGSKWKTGDLVRVTSVGDNRVRVVDSYGNSGNHGDRLYCWLTPMQLKANAPRKVVAAAKAANLCSDKSTAYGLLCTMEKNHDGDKHRHDESGAEWEKKDVIKLNACYYGCEDATGAAALSVGTARVVSTGVTRALCLKCMLDNEASIARRTGEHDKAHPQPRHAERFMVESHTLEAGGVFGIGR